MNRYKKAQAALEFLMTYGWAILVVLVAISALVGFGVVSPDRFLPPRCNFQAGFGCNSYKTESTGITVVAQNSLGYDITDVQLKAEGCGVSSSIASMPNQGKGTFTVSCTLTGSKYKGAVNLTYTDAESITHTNQGEIIAKLE